MQHVPSLDLCASRGPSQALTGLSGIYAGASLFKQESLLRAFKP